MASAADVTFKDVVREACLSRDHFMAWTDSRRQRRCRGGADFRRARRRSRTTASRTSSARSSTDRICRDRAGKTSPPFSPPAARPTRTRRRGCARRWCSPASTQVERISRRVPHRGQHAAQIGGDQETLRRQAADRADWFDAEAGRLDALIERRRALIARDRTEALLQIATAAAANYRREKQERGLLDYDDLIDKTLAMLDRRRLGLGALQARPRRRSRADRRGAGHQPPAMGYRRPYHFRIHLRRGRARRRRAHGVRGRRREAVDLFVSGRGSARIRRPPQVPAPQIRGRRAEVRSDLVHLFVPVRAGDPADGRPRVPRPGDLRQHSRRRDRLSDPPFARRRRTEPDRSLGTGGSRRPAGHRGLARAVRRRFADESGSETLEANPGRDQIAGRKRHH